MSKTLAVLLMTVATAAMADTAVPGARFSSVAILTGPNYQYSESFAAGTNAVGRSDGSASVTMGANAQLVPFIAFNATSADRAMGSAYVAGNLGYEWSIAGTAADGELIPVTITTLGHYAGQVTATALRADVKVGASVNWMGIGISSRFDTWGAAGLDTLTYGVTSGNLNWGVTRVLFDDTAQSAPGGTVTATGEAAFSTTFTVLVRPNIRNAIDMQVYGAEGNYSLASSDADYSWAFDGYIDPVITIDAAFADRFSLVQSSIPIVAVPVSEASTLAMMFAGLGMLGCLAVRRRSA